MRIEGKVVLTALCLFILKSRSMVVGFWWVFRQVGIASGGYSVEWAFQAVILFTYLACCDVLSGGVLIDTRVEMIRNVGAHIVNVEAHILNAGAQVSEELCTYFRPNFLRSV